MQMSDAVEVVQVAGSTQANQKLAEGWMLLAVVPNANNNGQSHVAYVLGKPAAPAIEEPRAPSARTIEALAAAKEAMGHIE
mgnify:CR=1 FL=1